MARAHARHKAPVPAPTPTPAVASATPLISAEAWRYVALYVAILVLLLAVYPARAPRRNTVGRRGAYHAPRAQKLGRSLAHLVRAWRHAAVPTRWSTRPSGSWRTWLEMGRSAITSSTSRCTPLGGPGLRYPAAPQRGWRHFARLSSLPSIPFTPSRSPGSPSSRTRSRVSCLSRPFSSYLRFDDTRRTAPLYRSRSSSLSWRC